MLIARGNVGSGRRGGMVRLKQPSLAIASRRCPPGPGERWGFEDKSILEPGYDPEHPHEIEGYSGVTLCGAPVPDYCGLNSFPNRGHYHCWTVCVKPGPAFRVSARFSGTVGIGPGASGCALTIKQPLFNPPGRGPDIILEKPGQRNVNLCIPDGEAFDLAGQSDYAEHTTGLRMIEVFFYLGNAVNRDSTGCCSSHGQIDEFQIVEL